MSFVTTLDSFQTDKLRDELEKRGFVFSYPDHMVFCAKNSGISCSLYLSGKLVIQGKEKQDFIEFFLEPEILKSFSQTLPESELDLRPRIGVDESGKGDFFGPLCIAGVFADNEKIVSLLHKNSIRDSKKIGDASILKLAKIIKESCIYEVVRIEPEKYNLLYDKFRNLNELLAWGHAKIIEKLESKICSHGVFAISDKFADENVLIKALKNKNISIPVYQKVRAESDVVVAAASILSREDFILSIKKLEKIHGLVLPKGAGSTVKNQAVRIAFERGYETLQKVCKRHFKTYDEITDILETQKGK
ncbi:MAG: ribonuclease HIII [Victivallaceae bacterium]